MRMGLLDIRVSRSWTETHQINKDVIGHEMNSIEPVRFECTAESRDPLNRP